MYRDLKFYYNVDLLEVIRGDGPPPFLVLELIRLLPPGSACEAIEVDEPSLVGFDLASRLLVDVSDWGQIGAIAGGNWAKGKAPKFNGSPRPWVRKRAKSGSGVTLADFQRVFSAKVGG